jgi:hypothetical protein
VLEDPVSNISLHRYIFIFRPLPYHGKTIKTAKNEGVRRLAEGGKPFLGE